MLAQTCQEELASPAPHLLVTDDDVERCLRRERSVSLIRARHDDEVDVAVELILDLQLFDIVAKAQDACLIGSSAMR